MLGSEPTEGPKPCSGIRVRCPKASGSVPCRPSGALSPFTAASYAVPQVVTVTGVQDKLPGDRTQSSGIICGVFPHSGVVLGPSVPKGKGINGTGEGGFLCTTTGGCSRAPPPAGFSTAYFFQRHIFMPLFEGKDRNSESLQWKINCSSLESLVLQIHCGIRCPPSRLFGQACSP